MTRVLFSPHAIRTSEERHVESPVKGLLNEKLPLSPEPYKPLSQLKYPGGQGGPTEYFFSEDLVPHCPVTSPFTQGSENLMTLQKVSADSASPRSCNRRLFGSPLEAKENDFNQSTSTPPSSLKTFHAVGKHEDIFSTSASPSPLKERIVKAPWESPVPLSKTSVGQFPREVAHHAHYQGSGMQAIQVPKFVPSLKQLNGLSCSSPIKNHHVSQLTLTPKDPIPSFREVRPDSIVRSPRRDLTSQFSLG